jgi:hypothetical protein
LLRTVANLIAPGMSPYTFLFPACLLATLFAGWQSGILTALIVGTMSQFLVVPEAMHNGLPMRYPLQAGLIAAIGAVAIIGIAEGFRRGVLREASSTSAQAADRGLLYHELQHRVGNNLAIVANLLDLQRQRADDPISRAALKDAIGRVRSISQIHRRLDSWNVARRNDHLSWRSLRCLAGRDLAAVGDGASLHSREIVYAA